MVTEVDGAIMKGRFANKPHAIHPRPHPKPYCDLLKSKVSYEALTMTLEAKFIS